MKEEKRKNEREGEDQLIPSAKYQYKTLPT